ncbi:hypothetical protein [Arthrobacter pascens]|uniref:hypothetical protein n=1 Tax=Arthrobacter pascens TaxID=1677 RepID=UPI00196B2E7D|nr:hypothetical protein [Arthrobacter pascens]MBN3497349.1 hypothetical protein [Arthrobacter pascens]
MSVHREAAAVHDVSANDDLYGPIKTYAPANAATRCRRSEPDAGAGVACLNVTLVEANRGKCPHDVVRGWRWPQ